jgi:hypothetical protein
VSSAEPPVPERFGLSADALLAGPRGRSLCVNSLDDRLAPDARRVRREWLDALHAVRAGDARRGARGLAECAKIADLSASPLGGSALMAGLVSAVGTAEYWAQPDDEDRGFADERAREALRPVAEAVVAGAAAPDVLWWTAPVDRGHQRYTEFLGAHPLPDPLLTGAVDWVDAWLAETRDNERSAQDRPEDPAAAHSGRWWSTPALSRLPLSTRALPALGAARLALVEDSLGWQSGPRD